MNVRHALGTIRNIIVKIFNIFPIQNYIIFESNPDFNDEGFWMCKKFIDEKMDRRYTICWILKDRFAKGMPDDWKGKVEFIYFYPKSVGEWIKKHYVLHTAKVILDSCQFVNKSRNGQFRFFLHHGGMPIKKISRYISTIGKFDYVSIGSTYFSEYYRSIGIPADKQVSFGMCRNDQLSIFRGCLKKLFDMSDYNDVIMWMPTYRQHVSAATACNIPVNKSSKTGLPVLDTIESFERINDTLRQQSTLLILKLHPSQDIKFLEIKEFKYIKVITNAILAEKEIQLYSILAEVDALITDYSSIYYDFLLLNRPIALTVDDLNIYKNAVGLIFENYKDEVKGFYIYDEKDFNRFLKNYKQLDISEIREKCTNTHDVIDFTSTNKIFNFIVEKIK